MTPENEIHIMVVDDEPSMCEFMEIILERSGYQVSRFTEAPAAVASLETEHYDLVISDIKMPTISGLELLRAVKKKSPVTEIIMMTAFASTDTVIEAMKNGAFDYITKPFKVDEILITVDKALKNSQLQRENRRLQQELEKRFGFDNLIGKSPEMIAIYEVIKQVAGTKTNVLICGESGTGKELVARAIHFSGPNRRKPFVAVNCAAIPGELLESELFGHTRGAFTGAVSETDGYLKEAAGGTLFLDEIAEIPPAIQVKILRVIQEKRFQKVGSPKELSVDVRFVAATNRNLQEAVEQGEFRQDLFYRLNVIRIDLPPLRRRREDIPLLLQHFLQRYCREYQKEFKGFTPAARQTLMNHDYPGNIRELENLVERCVVLETGSELIALETLPPALQAETRNGPPLSRLPEAGIDLEKYIAGIEIDLIEQALRRCDQNKTRAAGLLGLSFRSLRYRLDKYDIQSESHEC
ncbi:MAG: sigma-54-dependent Fis family transcriptional regulator [Deltaproteobacteria bacterium]|nr:sigma-54-dependent Fis family transcriptional regulator [Deltaproteobacteria bacterium]